ncbi:MAG: 3-isopropylmalate dehydratase small subunit [Bacteroidota bacterium]
MTRFGKFSSRTLLLPMNDIDTDQIIPARFLKVTDKSGLGDHLFADWRYDAHGSPRPDFVLNAPGARGAAILVAGENFGCGSSREHAPWALTAFGFRAVISTSFADIFSGNALKNGLLPVTLNTEEHRGLSEAVIANPDMELTIDLAEQKVSLPSGRSYRFPIDGFAKTCLLEGVDELGYLLRIEGQIAAYEEHAMRK